MQAFCLSYFRRCRVGLVKFVAKYNSRKHHFISRDNITMALCPANLGRQVNTSIYTSSQSIQQQLQRPKTRGVNFDEPESINNRHRSYSQLGVRHNQTSRWLESILMKNKIKYGKYFLLHNKIEQVFQQYNKKLEIDRLRTMDRDVRMSMYREIIQARMPLGLEELNEFHFVMLVISLSQNAAHFCGEIIKLLCNNCQTMERDMLFNVAKIVVDSNIEYFLKSEFLTNFLKTVTGYELDKEDIILLYLYAGKSKCNHVSVKVCETFNSRVTEMIKNEELTETEVAVIFNTMYLDKIFDQGMTLEYIKASSSLKFDFETVPGMAITKFLFSHQLYQKGLWKSCSNSELAKLYSFILLTTTQLTYNVTNHRLVYLFMNLCRTIHIVSKEVCSKECIDRIAKISSKPVRIKDIGNFVFTLANMRVKPQESMQQLLRQFEDLAQTEIVPKCNVYFVSGLLGFSMMGVFPGMKLLNQLQRELKSIKYTKDFVASMLYDITVLDQTLKIEWPDNHVELLTKELLMRIPKFSKIFTRNGLCLNLAKNQSAREVMFTSVILELKYLGLEDCFDVGYVHTLENAELVICLDKEKKPMKLSQWELCLQSFMSVRVNCVNMRREKTIKSIINPLDNSLDKILVPDLYSRLVLFVVNPSSYFLQLNEDGTGEYALKGTFQHKMHCAKKLGYEIVEINPFEYKEVEDKSLYLKNKLETFINFDNMTTKLDEEEVNKRNVLDEMMRKL